MDRSNVVILISKAYSQDSIGQYTATETYSKIFCRVRSVSANEWFSGGQNGLNPQYQITVLRNEYSGQSELNIGGTIVNGQLSGGTRYSIYRTYTGTGDTMDLYAELKAGV